MDYVPPQKRMKFNANANKDSRKTTFMDMPDKCLMQVFRYLNLALGKLCSRLKDVICKQVLNTRIVNWNELNELESAVFFEMFWKNIAHVNFGTKDNPLNTEQLNVILNLINVNSNKAPGVLEAVEFYLRHDVIVHIDIMDVLPFFKTVRSLTIKICDVNIWRYNKVTPVNPSINAFLHNIAGNAAHLKRIEIENMRVDGLWLVGDNMKRLETLSFVSCTIEKNPCIITYMQRRPKLQHFTWKNSSIDRVFDTMNFILDLVLTNVEGLHSLSMLKNAGIIDNNIYKMNWNVNSSKYENFSRFTNLQELDITYRSFAQARTSLILLAKQNTITKLTLDIVPFFYNDYDMRFLQLFTSIKTIKLVHRDSYMYADLLKNVPNLQRLTITGENTLNIGDLVKYVLCMKNATVLKLEVPTNTLLPYHYKRCLEARKTGGCTQTLHLLLRFENDSLVELIGKLKRYYKPDIIKISHHTC